MTEAAGGAENDATALSALFHFLDDPRIDQLAQVLGLTSSGTVRLVDRLERLDLVERSGGADARDLGCGHGRWSRPSAEEVSRVRTELLDRALAALSPAERDQFGALAGKILVGIMRPPGSVRMDVPSSAIPDGVDAQRVTAPSPTPLPQLSREDRAAREQPEPDEQVAVLRLTAREQLEVVGDDHQHPE